MIQKCLNLLKIVFDSTSGIFESLPHWAIEQSREHILEIKWRFYIANVLTFKEGQAHPVYFVSKLVKFTTIRRRKTHKITFCLENSLNRCFPWWVLQVIDKIAFDVINLLKKSCNNSFLWLMVAVIDRINTSGRAAMLVNWRGQSSVRDSLRIAAISIVPQFIFISPLFVFIFQFYPEEHFHIFSRKTNKKKNNF